MSGRAKRIFYGIFEITCAILAIAGTVTVAFFGMKEDSERVVENSVALGVFGFTCLLLPLNVLVHEFGHLLAGLVLGMRFISVSVSSFQITGKGVRFLGWRGYAGETQMLPKSPKRVRAKTSVFSLGGAALNLIFGTVFLALFFVAPKHPALFFFELYAPFHLFEAFVALYPAELEAGRTDGKVFCELVKNTNYARVFLAVLTAQGVIYKKSFSEIDRELLYNVPVIREDELAFVSLTQLRWQYLFMTGDEAGATKEILRLEELIESVSDENVRAQLAAEFAYAHSIFFADERGAEFLQEMKQSQNEESFSYVLARYSVLGEGEESVRAAIEKEPAYGMRELDSALLDRALRARAKKNPPPKEQNQKPTENYSSPRR